MWRYSIYLILILSSFGLQAQECKIKLAGQLKDQASGEPLEFASVYIKESQRGAKTDGEGKFVIEGLCPGQFHLVLSHIGCESRQVFLNLKKDTLVQIKLEHNHKVLNKVQVKGKASSTQNTESINQQQITDNANSNLSNMLESLSGVSAMRNGNGIAKPVVHGMYGNRVTILNNGVAQSGQQWGNGHSPEIDPLVANRIQVIKGVSALEYPGSNLGSIILIEPKRIGEDPHLHGKSTYIFETNGRMHGLNLQLQRYSPAVSWKVNGTLKKSGDKKTSSYFLNNTGNNEANLALQLEKSYSEKLFTELYISTFNTSLGVLRGAQVGNVNDLKSALSREVPFYTEEKFSYQIDAPRQQVGHHLAKLKGTYSISDHQLASVTLAAQLNDRKEFDVRRGGRSDIPAMSLKQYNFFGAFNYKHEFENNLNLSSGVQLNATDNTNNPETGILPLIPDYFTFETGVFATLRKRKNQSFYEIGLRYDNAIQNVTDISQSVPRVLLFYENVFHNINATAGWSYRFHKNWQFNSNVGYATRNPQVNELYSSGLHQGVSGIEEGSVDLIPEKSLKGTLSLNAEFGHALSFEVLGFYQVVNDFIYLQPQNAFRTTIRGTFPVFKYEQTNARIAGLDFSAEGELTKNLHAKCVYSFIHGRDQSQTLPLINMPANNLRLSLSYDILEGIQVGNKSLENVEFSLTNAYVFRQSNLLPEQDFVLPPDAYNLLGAATSGDIQLNKVGLRMFIRANNLLNVAYRDYLNRQRYFSNDLGRSVTAGVSLKF